MNTAGERLIESLQEAISYAKGNAEAARVSRVEKLHYVTIPDSLNIKEIREHLKMSQTEFAARFGMNLYALRNWECGRRSPDMTTKAYLYAISRNAFLVEQALHS